LFDTECEAITMPNTNAKTITGPIIKVITSGNRHAATAQSPSMRSLVFATSVTLAALAGACGKTAQEDSRPGEPAGSPLSEAQAYYTARCVECHGATGAGDGPSADSFNPRPRNETDLAWQASVTDEQIREIIFRGGKRLGKSPAMPSNVRLRERPEVLDGLVQIVRSFGKHPRKNSAAPDHPVTPQP
jgi:mono/diheme cytochrome c family protein